MQAHQNGGYISSLANSEGIRVIFLQALSHKATQYYFAFFFKDSPSTEDEENMVLACIPSLVTNMMNEFLMFLVSLFELEEVVFGMCKGKAQGSDGFLVEFFQEFWGIVNLDLLEVVRESFGSKYML